MIARLPTIQVPVIVALLTLLADEEPAGLRHHLDLGRVGRVEAGDVARHGRCS